MQFNLSLDHDQQLVRLTETGEWSGDECLQAMREVEQRLEQHGWRRVLVDHRNLQLRLGTIEIHDRPGDLIDAGFNPSASIAYVFSQDQEENYRFFEDVAVIRGMSVKVFPTIADAEHWLLFEV